MEEEYKEDLRVLKSKKLLVNALSELLETVPFDKITVMEICNKAMIRRTTFYKHFESKDHLLEFLIEEMLNDLYFEIINEMGLKNVRKLMMSLIEKSIDYIIEKKNQILLIIEKNGIEKISILLIKTIKSSLRYLTSQIDVSEEFSTIRNTLIDFFSGGIVNIGLSWVTSSNPCTKEDLISFFNTLLSENTFIV